MSFSFGFEKLASFDIQTALKDVQEKSDEELDKETAFKWASRSIACYQLYKKTGKLRWFTQGEDYRHEALEHAALVKDYGKTLKTVEAKMDLYRVVPAELIK